MDGPQPQARRRRVLIVDDEKSVRDALRQLFEYEGHEVAMAVDGPEALTRFESFEPDVTFLDVKMPVLDGLAETRHIRALPGGRPRLLGVPRSVGGLQHRRVPQHRERARVRRRGGGRTPR